MTITRKDVGGCVINLFCQQLYKCVNCSDMTERLEKSPNSSGEMAPVCPILNTILDILPVRLAQIIRMRFSFYPYKRAHTTKEISAVLDVSRERIRQLEQRTLRLLSTGARADYIVYLKKRHSLGINIAKCPPNVDANMPIEAIFDSIRVINCLHSNNIYKLNDLLTVSYLDLFKMHSLGNKSLYEIREKMKELNIRLLETH